MKNYRIHWKLTTTGVEGWGTALFEKSVAEQLAERFNKQYSDLPIVHWAEPVDDITLAVDYQASRPG